LPLAKGNGDISRPPRGLYFAIGMLCMYVAVFEATVTYTSTQARSPGLRQVLAFAAVADGCLAVVVWRGRWAWRVAAGLVILPTPCVVSEFLRRGSGLF
jgi:hypothetical protein